MTLVANVLLDGVFIVNQLLEISKINTKLSSEMYFLIFLVLDRLYNFDSNIFT